MRPSPAVQKSVVWMFLLASIGFAFNSRFTTAAETAAPSPGVP